LTSENRALAELAASVADGEAVDWQSAEARAARGDRRLIQHLRLVESIATLYRSLPAAEPLEDPNAEAEARRVTEPAGPRWGRLVMLDRIGEGTSSEVYRAWDSELHREVALKLLHDEGTRNQSRAHAQMLEEARRLARIRHAHVVQVYGAEQHDGRVGLWMELVRGESLEQVLKTRGPFGAHEAALTGLDVCASLAAVHGAGLLHRDVKAQNVMRESGGRLVLMDFGTGEELRRDARSPRMVGTPLYLAPELFLGQPASVQSDLYSVGVLLFYLATGDFPVTAASMEQLALAHSNRQRRRLRDLRPDLPEGFVRVVERALHTEPARRYASAGEMEAALREALDVPGRAGEAGPVPAAVVEKSFASAPWWNFGLAIGAVALLCVAVGLIVWSRGNGGRAPAAPLTSGIRSIAVLPMTDLSGSQQAPYLADGLHDQLITTLGQIQSLRVTSRTSVMQFKDSRASAAEIAKKLGVDAVLRSTVSWMSGASAGSPGRLRVNASLMTAGASTPLWSHEFERAIGDLRALEADVAGSIAKAVSAAVTPGESKRLSRSRQTNAVAEQAFFQGRFHLAQYGLERSRRALEAFQRAVQLDPGYAAAHAGMARCYFNLGFDGAMSQAEARASALSEATRAVALDEDLSEAHVAIADLKFYYDWDWAEADAEYRRAIDLNPSSAYARSQYARYLSAARRFDEAVAQSVRATELDPLSAEAAQTAGLVFYYKGDLPAAANSLQAALTLDPRYARAHYVLGRVYEADGHVDQALEETNRAIELADGAGTGWSLQLVRLLALSGRRAEARGRLAEITRAQAAGKLRVSPEQFAYAYLGLGEADATLSSLEHAVDERDPAVLWLAADPRFAPLHGSQRFGTLLARLRVP
jgi:TolB-like protein/Tfp pilus assembly protein PilF